MAYTLRMHAELEACARSIHVRFEQMAEIVEGMTAAQLNARPPIAGANSAWVLAVHTAGNAQAWIHGIACGNPVRRDRPAEFASTGDDARRLAADLRRTAAAIDDALSALDPARLDTLLVPAKELWGESEPREISVRAAILQVIEHASLHLGHLQMTRDLAGRG